MAQKDEIWHPECLSRSLQTAACILGIFQGKSIWENHCWLSGLIIKAKSCDIRSQLSLLPAMLTLLCCLAIDAPEKGNQACTSSGQMASQTWWSGSVLADTRLDLQGPTSPFILVESLWADASG